MADENSRYNVTITLDIRDATTGEPTPFSRTIQEYSGLKYEDMQMVQGVSIGALAQALIAEGNEKAEAMKTARGQGKGK